MGVLDRRHPIDPVDTVIGIWLAWNLGTGAYVYGHLIYWTVFAIVSIHALDILYIAICLLWLRP
jgi:hypothetical protein